MKKISKEEYDEVVASMYTLKEKLPNADLSSVQYWLDKTTVVDDTDETLKNHILGVFNDAMADFLYYDRKDDESLKQGDIEAAIASGIIEVDELLDVVRKNLGG